MGHNRYPLAVFQLEADENFAWLSLANVCFDYRKVTFGAFLSIWIRAIDDGPGKLIRFMLWK